MSTDLKSLPKGDALRRMIKKLVDEGMDVDDIDQAFRSDSTPACKALGFIPTRGNLIGVLVEYVEEDENLEDAAHEVEFDEEDEEEEETCSGCDELIEDCVCE